MTITFPDALVNDFILPAAAIFCPFGDGSCAGLRSSYAFKDRVSSITVTKMDAANAEKPSTEFRSLTL